MANQLNPYTCLGLMPGNSQADIKRRYRQLAKQYHPDRNGHTADSEKKLRDLNDAYALLSDPVRKSAYDAPFTAPFHPEFYRPARVPQTVFSMPYIPRRSRPRRAAASLALLLLLSTGFGAVLSAVNNSPALSGLLMRMSSKPVGPERPPQPYSFLPAKGPFDDESSSPLPSPAPSGNPQPQ